MGEGEESKRLTRALILNALVLPGSGHVTIGDVFKGVTMASATIVFLLAPIIRFITAFQAAMRSQPPPGIEGSLNVLAAVGQAWKAHGAFILICLLAVILVWAYGIGDIAVKIKRGRTGDRDPEL
jgi:hypothetical protein